jgi:hypothetical protein
MSFAPPGDFKSDFPEYNKRIRQEQGEIIILKLDNRKPSRLARISEAFTPVPYNDWGSEAEYMAEREEKRGLRRLVYAGVGEVVGAVGIAAGAAMDSRNAVYAGAAACLLSTLYLGMRVANHFIMTLGRGDPYK